MLELSRVLERFRRVSTLFTPWTSHPGKALLKLTQTSIFVWHLPTLVKLTCGPPPRLPPQALGSPATGKFQVWLNLTWMNETD